MSKKILFICDWDFTLLMSKLSLTLKEEWYNTTSAVIVWKTYKVRLDNNIIESNFKNKYLLQDILEEENPEKYFNSSKLTKLEERYWNPTLLIYLWADRSFVYGSYEKNMWRLISLFEYFEDIYSKEKPDYIVTNAYAAIAHLISYAVWSKIWIKFIQPVQLRFARKTFFVNTQYEDIILPKEPSKKILVETKKFLINYKKSAKQWDFYTVSTWDSNSQNWDENISKLFLIWRYFYRYYISRDYRWDHTKKSPFGKIFNEIKWKSEKFIVYKKLKFDELKKWQKYVYFPLHLQPEASTMTLAPFYLNQIATLEALSKSIKSDTLIVIKEHPHVVWYRWLDYYKEIRKFSNVIFVNPKLDSLDLIRWSEIVFTLTWTASLEAMMLWKPSIVVWNTYFSKHKLILNLQDIAITKWHEVIYDYLNKYSYEEKSVIEFIAIYIASSNDILMVEPGDYKESPILKDENINNITEALIENLNYLEKN